MTPTLLAALALSAAPPAHAPSDSRDGVAFFESKIRPVLVQQCYRCHSAEAKANKKLKGGLYVDTRRGLRDGGDSGPALVPGKSADSLLVRALRHDSTKMPPDTKLPDAVVADFARWVDMGAPDPRHGVEMPAKRVIDLDAGKKLWAFRPLTPVTPPEVKDMKWVRNPIDRFILAELEKKGLTPSKPLSKEKLLRRAAFDLTGLPPTPEEIENFTKDGSANAYAALVQRLRRSERHGERWARHWLDVARYAESGGYEFDGDRAGAYHYRDFVIKALNADMPFNEFVKLQLAGDELKPNDLLATAATGFLVSAPYPGQTTAKTLEPIRYDHLDDMLATAGTALLGLTLGCARCHEHKYDPIPQQDYYRLLAALGRTDSTTRNMDPDPEAFKRVKAAFDKEHAPLLAALRKYETEELPLRFAKWLESEKAKPSPVWLTLTPTDAKGRSPLKTLEDGSVLSSGKAGRDTYTIIAKTALTKLTGIRLETLADASLPKSGPGRGADGNFSLTEITLTAAPVTPDGKKKPAVVKLKLGASTLDSREAGKGRSAVYVAEAPFGFEGGTVLTVALKFERDSAAGRVRLAFTTDAAPKIDSPTAPQASREIFALVLAQGGKLDGKHRGEIAAWFRAVDARSAEAFAPVAQHSRKEPKPPLVPVFSAQSGRGGDVFYLIRGETGRKNGVAKPGFAQVLINAGEGRWLLDAKAARPPRVALAEWITDDKHGAGHLLARVIVNRLWQHHFGKGLVRTPNDFGAQGDPPTHPELLDWLAGELIRGGWKLGPIHELMMTSATYQQSGAANESAQKTDPQNKLWWRVPPRRLEAEPIRDAVLAVGGSLDLTMYGAGSLDENSSRRSIYMTVKRTRLPLMLQAFDAPEATGSVGERSSTTAATQALLMMNSRLVRANAEKLAKRIAPANAAQVPAAVEKAYRIALGRSPDEGEKRRMTEYILRTADGTKGAPALAMATADFCQVLLCLNEFLYID